MSHPYPSRKIRVIHLSGGPFEIGRQHAEIMGNEMALGMTGFYSAFWKRLMSPKAAGGKKVLFWLGTRLIDPILLSQLSKRLPESYRSLIQGLSGGDGNLYRELIRSAVLPDMMPILLSLSAQIRPYSVIPAQAPARFGCSSFFSSSETLLHGRNLDFPGVGYWDRYPVIQMNNTGSGLKYIGFTTAGVPMCGVTGVNEAQLSVSLHQHYGRFYSFKGVPPFVTAEKILQSARTIDEALKILRNSRVSAAWAFLIGDGKARDAAIYECHPKASGVIRLSERNGILAHSNYFQTSECVSAGYATSGRMNWDNYWRKTRLEQNVRSVRLTPELACQFLSEHVDGFQDREKMINRTVSQVYNVQSILMDLVRMRVWMAEGDCPIHLREYAEFDLGEIFAGRDGRTGQSLPGYQFKDQSIRMAKQSYILSFKASFDGDDRSALQGVKEALGHSFSVEAALVAAVLLMKTGEYSVALGTLERAVESLEKGPSSMLPPEYFETLLFLARCYDLMGKNGSEALYRRVREHSENGDVHLKKLASPKRKYSWKDLDRVLTPYSSYIPFE